MTKQQRDDADELIQWQHNRCAICRRTFTLSRIPCLDHNHATGEERGALCHSCNGLIGLLNEDARWLMNAAEYLLDPPSRECWTEPRWWPDSPGAAGLITIPTKEVDK